MGELLHHRTSSAPLLLVSPNVEGYWVIQPQEIQVLARFSSKKRLAVHVVRKGIVTEGASMTML